MIRPIDTFIIQLIYLSRATHVHLLEDEAFAKSQYISPINRGGERARAPHNKYAYVHAGFVESWAVIWVELGGQCSAVSQPVSQSVRYRRSMEEEEEEEG